MVSDNGRFRVSSAMAEYIKMSELAPEAKKLLLALIHFQHLEAEGWPSVSFDCEGFFFHVHHDTLLDYARRVGDFRDLGFAPASGDTCFLARPVASLLKNTGLFDLLELTGGRPRAICWKLSMEAAWLMTDNDRYALMHKNDTEILPARLAAVEANDSEERSAINALWAQMRFAGIGRADTMAPGELLALDTWRAIWTSKRPDLSRNSQKTYRNAVRRLLLRAAPKAQDPVRVVRDAWSHLPNEVKVTLAPIRKSAELAMLRPVDVTPGWIGQQSLSKDERETVVDMITDIETTIASAHNAARPCPIQTAWRTLRSTAEDRGFSTRGLGKVETRALEDARTPGDLDVAWAQANADALPRSDRAKFTMALRLLDDMRKESDMALILPEKPISAVQDKRRHGRSPLPEALKVELGALAKESGMSANTLRTWRSAAAALSNITAAQTLADLLSTVQSVQGGLSDRQTRVIGNIKKAVG